MKRLPGKRWLDFDLFGLTWRARIVRADHSIIEKALAIVYFEERVMYFSDANSTEQLATALAHEIQHVIEEHADVDYEVACTADVSDRRTDSVSRGWLYLIRSCPEVVRILRGRPTTNTR